MKKIRGSFRKSKGINDDLERQQQLWLQPGIKKYTPTIKEQTSPSSQTLPEANSRNQKKKKKIEGTEFLILISCGILRRN